MAKSILLLLGLVSLAAVINAQCSTTDHPNCVSWANNGFCTNPSYTKEYIQKYCPNTCPMTNCICPIGWRNTGPTVNRMCATGSVSFLDYCCRRLAK